MNFLRNFQVSFFGSSTLFFSGNQKLIVPTQIQSSSKNFMERMAYIKLIETETMSTLKEICLGKDKITDSVYKPIFLKN